MTRTKLVLMAVGIPLVGIAALAFVGLLWFLRTLSFSKAGVIDGSSNVTAAAKTGTPSACPVTPFDKTLAVLPAQFEGQDVSHALLCIGVPPKGEFERTPDYVRRLHSRPQPKTYGFAMPEVLNRITYDPDTEIMSLPLSLIELPFLPRGRDTAVSLSDDLTDTNTYDGFNAFNAHVTVTRREYVDSGVLAAPLNVDVLNLVPLKVSVPRARAEALKPLLRVLAVCNAYTGSESPYETSTGRSTPTIDNPQEVIRKHFVLRVATLELWVYNFQTGEILSKTSAAKLGIPSSSH
jgi:hypothetical protein